MKGESAKLNAPAIQSLLKVAVVDESRNERQRIYRSVRRAMISTSDDDGLTMGACTNEQKGQKGMFGHPVKEAPAWKRRFLGEGETKVYKHAQSGIGTTREGDGS